ncbi:hypothetical protein [Acidithiobacillus sp.]|uniref:hypothetical protein n=1 Tax=Acidithiobacillus sp. TaxID=1872118 RepID=UPI002314E191|nr:hypothetical protein [Acidithiobacillus sp.]MDA8246970.1 hypothetical protein [Acidithiobacillus sp.]
MGAFFKYGNDTGYDLNDEDLEYAMLMDGSIFSLGRWPECGLEKDVLMRGGYEESARQAEQYRKNKEEEEALEEEHLAFMRTEAGARFREDFQEGLLKISKELNLPLPPEVTW